MQWLQYGVENQNKEIHGSITTHTGRSIPFVSHVKHMVRFFFNTSIFLKLLFYMNMFN
jgi:hypothetical protein